MENAVMDRPTGGLSAAGEIPGTGKMASIVTGTIGVDTMVPSRERSQFFQRQLEELNVRSVSSWRESLSEDDRSHLAALVRKTTNTSRLQVLTSGDGRGLAGYFQHAQIPEFPERLYRYAMLDNASINRILRAL